MKETGEHPQNGKDQPVKSSMSSMTRRVSVGGPLTASSSTRRILNQISMNAGTMDTRLVASRSREEVGLDLERDLVAGVGSMSLDCQAMCNTMDNTSRRMETVVTAMVDQNKLLSNLVTQQQAIISDQRETIAQFGKELLSHNKILIEHNQDLQKQAQSAYAAKETARSNSRTHQQEPDHGPMPGPPPPMPSMSHHYPMNHTTGGPSMNFDPFQGLGLRSYPDLQYGPRMPIFNHHQTPPMQDYHGYAQQHPPPNAPGLYQPPRDRPSAYAGPGNPMEVLMQNQFNRTPLTTEQVRQMRTPAAETSSVEIIESVSAEITTLSKPAASNVPQSNTDMERMETPPLTRTTKTETKTAETKTKPTETKTKPNETKTKPNETKTKPAETKPKPRQSSQKETEDPTTEATLNKEKEKPQPSGNKGAAAEASGKLPVPAGFTFGLATPDIGRGGSKPTADLFKTASDPFKSAAEPNATGFSLGGFSFTQTPIVSSGQSGKAEKEAKKEEKKKAPAPAAPAFKSFSFGSKSDEVSAGSGTPQSSEKVFGSGTHTSDMSFKSLAESESGTGFQAGPSPFPGAGTKLFARTPKDLGSRKKGSESDADEDYEPNVDFQPVVPLPDLVEVKTGEENEEVLLCQRAKLYRWVPEQKEFKERGLGDIKVLRHTENKKVRILMRREQVHKICANHFLSPDMELKPMAKSELAWTWSCTDFSEDEPATETLAVRFKTQDLAEKFREAFAAGTEAMRLLKDSLEGDGRKDEAKGSMKSQREEESGKKPADKPGDENSQAWGDRFKPAPGSWVCSGCMTRLNGDQENCPCCGTRKDGEAAAAKPSLFGAANFSPKDSPNNSGQAPRYAFGLRGPATTTTSASSLGQSKLSQIFGKPTQNPLTKAKEAMKSDATQSPGSPFGEGIFSKIGSNPNDQSYHNRRTSNESQASEEEDRLLKIMTKVVTSPTKDKWPSF